MAILIVFSAFTENKRILFKLSLKIRFKVGLSVKAILGSVLSIEQRIISRELGN